MKIGIIGAGFTGLSAAYYLSQQGHEVEIFEKDSLPGGLAVGYKEKNWDWTLEKHYHHWFTNDKSVLTLAAEINHKVLIPRPKTSSFVDGKIYQLDSPVSLMKFPRLSVINRLRMGMSLAFLKYNPFWKMLEQYEAEPYLMKSMGEKGYDLLWRPLMDNKLGKYASKVSLAWFWARVYKRTPSLAYPEGGFLNFANHLQKKIEEKGGKFHYNSEVLELSSNDVPSLRVASGGGPPSSERTVALVKGVRRMGEERRQDPQLKKYDKIIVTLPSFFFLKIASQLPNNYKKSLSRLKGIGAVNLMLRLRKQFLEDGSYWLSMCDSKSPILAIVEHTNYMDKKHYGNEHVVYVGNYMETSDPKFSMTAEQLLKLYDPWLKKINPNYTLNAIDYTLFRAPFAQPIIFPNYSKQIPPFKTPLENVYLANIEQVYPWDRGTNYAVELGRKISDIILHEN